MASSSSYTWICPRVLLLFSGMFSVLAVCVGLVWSWGIAGLGAGWQGEGIVTPCGFVPSTCSPGDLPAELWAGLIGVRYTFCLADHQEIWLAEAESLCMHHHSVLDAPVVLLLPMVHWE